MGHTLLDEIAGARRENFLRTFSEETRDHFKKKAASMGKPRDFFIAVSGKPPWALVAEIKSKSPSRGILVSNPDVPRWSRLYQEAGARALSIVTEEDYFNGQGEWIEAARNACTLPVLRKDFLTSADEVLESRALGADAVLLIAAILNQELLSQMVEKVFELGMEPVVEVHTAEEARMALQTRTRIIGVNNRDLRDFSVNTQATITLLPLLENRVVISESGFREPRELELLAAQGVRAFLIGETFLTADNPPETVKNFVAGTGKSAT